jgi:polar amino acid transport system ATP-binding protein
MIEIKDLNKHFGELHVLKGIDTTVQKGEVIAIIGPSGSGKSTYLRCINRMEEPTGGHIFIDGKDMIKYGKK